jgi:xanthine dehydrogenase accessory factor
MRGEILQLAAELTRNHVPFVLAVVVRREPASSAQLGNTALITESGEFHGWLGGSCIQPTVLREAMAALVDAAPRLLALSPTPDADRRPGVTTFPMTCHSGGSVDIYIEPVLPAPTLLVFGVAPVAQALARLAKGMGYTVVASDPDADRASFPDADRLVTAIAGEEWPSSQRARLVAVVATLGQHDEDAIQAALALEPAYLGVVASRKRFAQIRETLAARGVAAAALDSVVNPAGLDIGARAPEEVALSILAEIVKKRRAAVQPGVTSSPPAAAREERDPVCGMTVASEGARHRAEHAGRTYYFCCAGCRERFLAAPDQYSAVVVSLKTP